MSDEELRIAIVTSKVRSIFYFVVGWVKGLYLGTLDSVIGLVKKLGEICIRFLKDLCILAGVVLVSYLLMLGYNLGIQGAYGFLYDQALNAWNFTQGLITGIQLSMK